MNPRSPVCVVYNEAVHSPTFFIIEHVRTGLHAAKPASVASGSGNSSFFPASLGFTDSGVFVLHRKRISIKLMIHIGLVPIYDVREIQNFRFTTASLNSLHQLPRFRKDKADPASNKYIASVGYALNSWSRSRNIGSDFCVTMNILFVIIVAKALEEEAV